MQDFANLGAENVCVMTDKNLSKLPVMTTVVDALTKARVNFQVFDDVGIEPTDDRLGAVFTPVGSPVLFLYQ